MRTVCIYREIQIALQSGRLTGAFNIAKCKVLHVGRNNPAYEYSMLDLSINTTVKLLGTKVERDLGVQRRQRGSTNFKANQDCTIRSVSNQKRIYVSRTRKNQTPLSSACQASPRVYVWNPHLIKDSFKARIDRLPKFSVNGCQGSN